MPVGIYQDVRRFQVAMDDQVTVRMRDPRAHQQKQIYPRAQVEWRCILIDRDTLHMLHHQVGSSVLGMSRIQQPCDGRMAQIGKELALSEETLAPRGPVRIGAKQFDGDFLLDFTVPPLRQVDRTHAARPEQLNQPVWSARAGKRAVVGTQYFVRRIRYISGKRFP